MYIFITIFALTWTNGFIFFHKGCYYHGGLLPHLFLFCMTCLQLVCPTLVILLLLLQLQHCTFVILTCQLWNKQGRLQLLLFFLPFFVWLPEGSLSPAPRSMWENCGCSSSSSRFQTWRSKRECESNAPIMFLKIMFVSILNSTDARWTPASANCTITLLLWFYCTHRISLAALINICL